MTVPEFLSIAAQLQYKTYLAVVRNSDKFDGIYVPNGVPLLNVIELFDVTHYHGIYIDNYDQFS